MRQTLRSTLFALALTTPFTAFAGPVRDFETDLSAAYAAYRAALFQTNQKDGEKSAGALQQLQDSWNGLLKKWADTPPPHFLDDPKFAETMKEIGRIADKAKDEIATAGGAAAHDTLEKIRDMVGDLRLRNGLLTYSDRVNEYHEVMEKTLGRDWSVLDANAFGELRERAAVLAHLAGELQKTAPVRLAKDSEFDALSGAVTQSADAVLKAARAGDEAAAKTALKSLKPAYSKFFLKFG